MTRIAVITGTTHGIGTVTAREVARAGFAVVMLVRNVDRGRQVAAAIRSEVPAAQVDALQCDLADFASVRAAAAEVSRQHPPPQLLINNAGVVTTRRGQSADGFELTFATNHLGPFLLTELLRPRLSADARIVNVASRIHFRAAADFEAVADPKARYRAQAAYARSKLANVMYTFALSRRLVGTSITSNCLHPGVVASNLLPRWLRLIKPLISPEIIDVERGAKTTLHLALAPELAGLSGLYFDEHQRPRPALELAYDEALQERLWRLSSRWAGID